MYIRSTEAKGGIFRVSDNISVFCTVSSTNYFCIQATLKNWSVDNVCLLFDFCVKPSETLFVMSGSCHLDSASNVEIGIECQIFVIVIFFNLHQVLKLWPHSRCYKGTLNQKRSFLVSMTSLLTHTVAHSTRPSFRLKTNNQPLKKFLSLAVSWVKVVKNGKILTFKVNFLCQKLSETF